MRHELYLRLLSAMFLFWNGARVLTYVPTIGKLLARGADVRSYSLLSWGCWALSNGTFALMLLEMSRGIPNSMFWMNLANTLMCVVVSFIILFRRFPQLHTRARGDREIARNDWHLAAVLRAGSGSRVLWAAIAGAVVIAAAGAATSGVWFNQDQHGPLEAVASAQPEHGISGAILPMQQRAPSLPHAPVPSLGPASGTAVASAGRVPAGVSARLDRRATGHLDSAPRQPVAAGSTRVNQLASQNRRHSASRLTAIARQMPPIVVTTVPIQQTSPSPRVAPASSLAARGTAVAGAEPVPRPPASPDHRALPSPDSAATQLAGASPEEASNFVTQIPRPPAAPVPAPAYESPPPVVYEVPRSAPQRPLVVYQVIPVIHAPPAGAYGYAYEDEYGERRWRGNGRHRGWRVHHQEGNDDE